MDVPNAIKWSVVNRLLTAGAVVVGVVLVVVGFVLGFGGAIELLIDDPSNPSSAIEQANLMLTLVFAVLGLVVWQLGKTYALFYTLPRASGRAAARRFDHERVKSEVLDGLDGRLTNIEEELEETRRLVQELKRAEHAAAFDPDESAVGGVDGSAVGGAGEPTTDGSDPTAAAVETEGESTAVEAGDDGEDRGAPAADDRSATPGGTAGEDEFTFGETESPDSTPPDEGGNAADGSRNAIDGGENAADESEEMTASAEGADRSTTGSESENDPLA